MKATVLVFSCFNDFMMPYEPRKIEKKWQAFWEENETFVFEEDSGDKKEYILDMFPYPSAQGLHVGHPEGYTATDIISRYQRMNGKNVLHPMGWDAFGLPAENYAIKKGVHPAKTTQKSIDNFRRQIKMLGFSYDWSREISTASPEYYQWTQWLFLYLYKKDLAYRKEAPVNWCPGCQTVLANEQVVVGACERCDSEVEQKQLKQWFFKVTAYADELLEELENLDWPERIKTMQRNWIGRSEGAELGFSIKDSELSIKTFTTRPDTLFGATYMVLAPEHSLVEDLQDSIKNWDEVAAYIHTASHKTEIERLSEGKDKTGVELTGVKAINPATGEEIPVWVADYVLATYGTGAIMAVPAHDERDFMFAKQYDLDIVRVIEGGDELPYVGEGNLVNSGEFNGTLSKEAREKITKHVGGEMKTQYRLRDWLISRQRYWGAPIPIVYCETCGEVPVPENDLPVELPLDIEFKPTGASPLKEHEDFVQATCPLCKGVARREADTMDTFVDSSWYYLRYIDPENRSQAFDPEKVKNAMPVDLYVGGAEHAVLHLLYARFIYKALADDNLVPDREPFDRLRNQGMILGPDGHRMSKSRGNVINPDEVVEEFGADAFRMYEMFMGPLEADKPWDTQGIRGVFRFLTKAWKMGEELAKGESKEASEELLHETHRTIRKVTDDIESFSFNTAVSALMILLSHIEKELNKEAFGIFLQLLYPFAPHLSSELWEKGAYGGMVWEQRWPEAEEKYLERQEITVAVQVDGKLRDTMDVAPGLGKEELEQKAAELEKVKGYLDGADVAKVIVVPDKLVNFVTKS